MRPRRQLLASARHGLGQVVGSEGWWWAADGRKISMLKIKKKKSFLPGSGSVNLHFGKLCHDFLKQDLHLDSDP